MKLNILSIILGAGVVIPATVCLLNPASTIEVIRRFPRSTVAGYLLTAIGTVWFLINLNSENIVDLESYKNFMFLLFPAIGLATCLYLKDFLAVRGLAVTILLLAKLMLDTARWENSSWRLVIVVWAYVLVCLGIWFTVSPWRLRDLIDWAIKNYKRFIALTTVKLIFGILLVILGIIMF